MCCNAEHCCMPLMVYAWTTPSESHPVWCGISTRCGKKTTKHMKPHNSSAFKICMICVSHCFYISLGHSTVCYGTSASFTGRRVGLPNACGLEVQGRATELRGYAEVVPAAQRCWTDIDTIYIPYIYIPYIYIYHIYIYTHSNIHIFIYHHISLFDELHMHVCCIYNMYIYIRI